MSDTDLIVPSRTAGVGEMLTETEHKAMAAVLDAVPRTAGGRRYQPLSIEVIWKRTTERAWRCRWITVFGPRLLKDGTLGVRETHEVIWLDDAGNPKTGPAWAPYEPAPEWALEFYRRSMPTWGTTR